MADTTEETRDTRANGGLTTADLAGGVERRDQHQEERDEQRQGFQPAFADSPNDMAGHDGQPEANQPAPPKLTEPGAALFSTEQASTLKSRWQEIQVGFVDEPRQAVEQADGLVAEVMQQLAQGFANERGALEAQWNSGQQKETEELRQAFRRYRTFFDRLLTI